MAASPPAAGSPCPVSSPMPGTVPSSIGWGEKTLHVFRDLSAQQGAGVGVDAFRTGLARLNVSLCDDTVTELFQSGDVNGDGVLSLDEWARWCELFPTLLDFVYFRSKDYWQTVRGQDEIDAARQRLDDLHNAESDAWARHAAAHADANAAARTVDDQAEVLHDVRSEEDAARRGLTLAQDGLSSARACLQGCVSDLAVAKDDERAQKQLLGDARHAADAAERGVDEADAELAEAQARLRELGLMLQEQQQAADRAAAGVEEARDQLAVARGLEGDHHRRVAAAVARVHDAAEKVQAGEDDLAQRAQEERDADAALLASQDSCSRAACNGDDSRRALAAAQDLEQQLSADATAAARLVEDQQRAVAELEQQQEAFAERRREVDAEEQPLIDKEIAIRRQRELLERSERELVNDVTAYTNRSISRPGVSLSPSPAREDVHRSVSPRRKGSQEGRPAVPPPLAASPDPQRVM